MPYIEVYTLLRLLRSPVATDSMHHTFDQRMRQDRLALLGLRAEDHALVARLQREVIAPHAVAIIDDLFRQLLAHEEAAAVLRRADLDLDWLKARQRDALLRFGVGFDGAAYFEDRLRLGLAYAQHGIPLSVYQGAHARLEALILAHIPSAMAQGHDTPQTYDALAGLVVRIGALDLSIALEAYHDLELDGWQASLQAERDEGRKWQSQVGRDSLTGLADHGHIIELLEKTLVRAQSEGRPLCVVMADVDFFKRVNDTYGHLVGDRALSEIAMRIAAALRVGDAVGRYGGEEFLIVLDNTSIDTGRRIAQRARARVGEDPIHIGALSVDITLSEGLAAMRAGDDVESLIARADAHLYRAKAAGRNCVSADPTQALACCAPH